jgi:7-carboxy-7-deazaguanine synthase
MTELLVNEMFETIQGEGSYTGTPAIFIRLQGCPVGCPWCDTKHTWEVLPERVQASDVVLLKAAEDDRYFKASTSELFTIIENKRWCAKHIVITGGEPCMYDLTDLTQAAINNGFSVQIETSGTYEVICAPDTWVTVSPKINMKAVMPVLTSAMLRANEIKHPIAMQKHIDELDQLLRDTELEAKLSNKAVQPLIYIQPISQLERATQLAVETCIKRNWRLSVQLHKYIGVE